MVGPRKEDPVKCPHCQQKYDELLIVTNVHGGCTFEGCQSCLKARDRDPRLRCAICQHPHDELVLGFNPHTGHRDPLCETCLRTVTSPDLERLMTPAA